MAAPGLGPSSLAPRARRVPTTLCPRGLPGGTPAPCEERCDPTTGPVLPLKGELRNSQAPRVFPHTHARKFSLLLPFPGFVRVKPERSFYNSSADVTFLSQHFPSWVSQITHSGWAEKNMKSKGPQWLVCQRDGFSEVLNLSYTWFLYCKRILDT